MSAVRHFLDPLTDPLGLLWVALLIVAVWSTAKCRWRFAAFPAGLLVLLSVCGQTTLAARWLSSLERPYAGRPIAGLPSADAVVVLGGILGVSSNEVFGLHLGPTADRVVTAGELIRLGKGRVVVVGGAGPGPGESGPTEAEKIEDWWRGWGLTNAPIIRLGACRNTREEALRTKELVDKRRWQSLLLVTSAWHMRRAEATFRHLGLPVTCAACDFQGLGRLENPLGFSLLPRTQALILWRAYLKERLAWVVYRWRGWVAG